MPVKALRALAWFVLFAGFGAIAAWSAGVALNDRYLWSQPLWWLPTFFVCCVAGAASAVAWALARVARFVAQARAQRGITPPPESRRFAAMLRVLVLASAALTVWAVVVEWRTIAHFGDTRAPEDTRALRVLSWNYAVDSPAGLVDAALQPKPGEPPEVILLVNPPWSMDLAPLREGLAKARKSDRVYATKIGRMNLLSIYPIKRWGFTDLKIKGAKARTFKWTGGGMVSVDSGQAFFAELDTTSKLGRPTVVWMLDLPSDPTIARTEMLGTVSKTLSEFRGPQNRRNLLGLDEPSLITDGIGANGIGFPLPDLIVGDMNTTRNSRSLDTFVDSIQPPSPDPNRRRPFEYAYRQAGWGPGASFPRICPLFAIDQCFVRAPMRADRYEVVDLGVGTHYAQLIELYVPAK